MRIIVLVFIILLNSVCALGASSMFDNDGNYSGNWKQMTNTQTNTTRQYSTSNYSQYNWQNSIKKQKALNNYNTYTNQNYIESSTVPFRYNTLDYTRSRKVSGGHGESYSARCHDIGDASFCH